MQTDEDAAGPSPGSSSGAAAASADGGSPSCWTQKPRGFFDIERYKRFLYPQRRLPPIVGAEIRKFQDRGALRQVPYHGKHLQNVTARV